MLILEERSLPMAEIKENQIIIEDDEGKKQVFEILFTYENEQRGHQYVFFYDPSEEENVIVMIYNDKGELFDIDDDEEYGETEEVFNAFIEEQDKKETKK